MAHHNFISPARIPAEVDGIQVNYCKNPSCPNYGVRPKEKVQRGLHGPKDNYRITHGRGMPTLLCNHCQEQPPLKSNRAVSEELARMLAPLAPPSAAGCPTAGCVNQGKSITAFPKLYQSFGATRSGSERRRCKACKRLFSLPVVSTLRQRCADKNEMIFKLLVNRSPMRRICKVMDIGAETLYQRIDFFYRQATLFAADREKVLLDGQPFRRLYISIDRQDYVINWTAQEDRRNVQLHAVGSADDKSGYVFGMHLDFDPEVDPSQVEVDAAAINDVAITPAHRKYARIWLRADYHDTIRTLDRERGRRRRLNALIASSAGVVGDITARYAETEGRADVEATDQPDRDTQLPLRGVQVHSEYTLYGHLFYLERLVRGAEKVRLYLDQESGIRAAALSAFEQRIKARQADVFYVSINKEMTVNERRKAKAEADAAFQGAKARFPTLSNHEVQIEMIKERLQSMATLGKWSDRWLLHPFPSMSEPQKAVCCLTDYRDYAPEQIARLYQRASLHAIDRYFMQLRRGMSLFERPLKTASQQGRTWWGYSPYNPEIVAKLLMVYRVYYNYIQPGEDKQTPAMRLGLATKAVSISDMLRFMPGRDA